MFGFTAIISLSFLLASQSAVAGSAPHNPRSLGLAIRAASDPTITPACTTACRQWNKTIDNIFSSNDSLAMCTNVVMSQFESCWDCEAYTGAASVNSLQDSINSLVVTCAQFGRPVNNVTIVAKKPNGGERLELGTLGSVALGLAMLALATL